MADTSESYPGFEEFFRADHARLVTFLIKIGFDRELAADAAEEAMLAVLQCWSDVRSPRAYVRAAARHAAIHHAERDRERLSRSIDGGWVTPEHADPFDGVDEAMDAVGRMARLLGTLPDRQRLVFAWHLEGFTNIEIAHYLEMRPTTVSSNLRHARTRLRSALGDPPRLPAALEGGARHDQSPRRDRRDV